MMACEERETIYNWRHRNPVFTALGFATKYFPVNRLNTELTKTYARCLRERKRELTADQRFIWQEITPLVTADKSLCLKRYFQFSPLAFPHEYLQEKNLDEPHHDDKVTLANVVKQFYSEAGKKKLMGARIRKVPWLLYDLDSTGISRQKELTLYKTRNSPRRIRYFLRSVLI